MLNYYDNEISSESASLTMRADFDNSKKQLSPGMDVKKATKDTMGYVSLVMSLGGGWENKYENPSALELVNL